MGEEERAAKIAGKYGLITGIVVAIITGVISFFVGKDAGINIGEQNTVKEINQGIYSEGSFSQNTINNYPENVDSTRFIIDTYNTMLANVDDLQKENTDLKEKLNDKSAEETEQICLLQDKIDILMRENKDLEDEKEELSKTLDEYPVIEFKDIGLVEEGIEININKKKSITYIDGKQYFSREIIDYVLGEDNILTLKDDSLHIRKVIVDRALLKDQYIIDSSSAYYNNVNDSYNNNYIDALYFQGSSGRIIYNLNGKYEKIKGTIAVLKGGSLDKVSELQIYADNVSILNVNIDKMTEPFEFEENIFNAKTLKIIYNSSYPYSWDQNWVIPLLDHFILYNE